MGFNEQREVTGISTRPLDGVTQDGKASIQKHAEEIHQASEESEQGFVSHLQSSYIPSCPSSFPAWRSVLMASIQPSLAISS